MTDASSLNPGAAALLERLRREGPLVSDGATGTFLQQHGLEPGGCPEEFNASRPEVVKEMARSYFEAGSDLVLTNSFGGSVFMQKKYGYEGRVFEFNKLAAQNARSQAPNGCYVVGSVGPTGEFLEPWGQCPKVRCTRRSDSRSRRWRRVAPTPWSWRR